MQVFNNNTAEIPQSRVQPTNQVCNRSCVAQSALEAARDFILFYFYLKCTEHYTASHDRKKKKRRRNHLLCKTSLKGVFSDHATVKQVA